MAVVEVREIAGGRSGGDSVEKGPNGVAVITREFTRSFIVVTDDPNDGWDTIKSSLPALSSRYQSGNDYRDDAKCVSRRGDQNEENRKLWECDCEYTTESPSFSDSEGESESVERELRQSVRWSTATVSQALTKDIDGVAILNAAGDPYDATQDVVIAVATITRYEKQATFAAFPLGDYSNAVNDDAFTLDGKNIGARWALFAGYEAVDTVVGAQQAKQVTYTLMIWPLTLEEQLSFAEISKWDAFLLQHGPNYIKDGVKRAAQEGGFRYNVNLDRLTGDKLLVTDDPEFSHYKTRTRANFGALGFRQ